MSFDDANTLSEVLGLDRSACTAPLPEPFLLAYASKAPENLSRLSCPAAIYKDKKHTQIWFIRSKISSNHQTMRRETTSNVFHQVTVSINNSNESIPRFADVLNYNNLEKSGKG